MSGSDRNPLSAYRRRPKRRGIARVELRVRRDDVVLLRGVATALADPRREDETRALLRERFGGGTAKGLKALLMEAPLDGIDLRRD